MSSSGVIREDLKEVVKKIMINENIKDYRIVIDGKSEIGENYTGEVIFCRVIPKNCHCDYHLVMKVSQKSDDTTDQLLYGILYTREIFAYSEVFPAFRKFIDEVAPDFQFDLVPRSYWCQNGIVVLEDMKESGFVLSDRTKTWNIEQSLNVMESYGKFHAISIAFRARHPELFQKLRKTLTNVFVEFENLNSIGMTFYEDLWNYTCKLLREAGENELVKKYDVFGENIREVMHGIAEEEDKLVICHGDCWNNNFLFKLKDQKTMKPSKVCLLDFQLMVVDSPVKDLSTNIYSTCDKSSLDQLDLLLKTYYKSLSTTVKCLGSNIDDFFSYQDLLDQWKKYSKFGIILCTELIKTSLLEKTEVTNMQEAVNQQGNTLLPKFSISHEEEYKRRFVDLLTHYSENFL